VSKEIDGVGHVQYVGSTKMSAMWVEPAVEGVGHWHHVVSELRTSATWSEPGGEGDGH
jgi:hypothetical protein